MMPNARCEQRWHCVIVRSVVSSRRSSSCTLVSIPARCWRRHTPWRIAAVRHCSAIPSTQPFAGAEALAEEARDLARSLNWFLPVISGGIDLLLNFARRQEPGRAEALVDEVAEGVQQGSGVHGWLWSMRFVQARAELALARGDWESRLRWANSAIEWAQTHGRRKYQVLGLAAQAQALERLGRTREAIADLRSAVELARPIRRPGTVRARRQCAARARR
jgi:tetratricopeptide (TPR) repeat protein